MIWSEFGEPIDDVQGLVSKRSDCIAFVANVGIPMRLEDADHVVHVKYQHETGNKEEEPSHSHPQIDDSRGCLVLLIHFFFEVDVISSHLEN